MDRRNVFLVGLDDYNRETLGDLPQAAECDFHAALAFEEMRDGGRSIHELIELAAERMAGVPGGPAGVASLFDHPGTVIAAILARRFGLPGPDLESVFRCEHKYWSRLEQRQVAADHIPSFRAFDPDDPDAFRRLDLIPPFWIKPIKSFRAYLAYSIQSGHMFDEVMARCRGQARALVGPFLELMREHGMPAAFTDTRDIFIAESPIGGAQCTLEGYVQDGRVVVYGVVDTIRDPDSSTFARYEYPSCLPIEIQHRMVDVARSVMSRIGYAGAPFNAEFFYDQSSDQVWLLELNPRASQSHADMFRMVHGFSHHAVVVDLALGRKPRTLGREGPWNVAAHVFLRTYAPGTVTRVPTPQDLDALRRRQPDTRVKIEVGVGTDLASLAHQDSYSFELATISIGGRDRREVLDRYEEALAVLPFEIERPASGPDG